jgi:hypothetical protein
MNRARSAILLLALSIGAASQSHAAVIIDKVPDVGPFWQPLGGSSGSYVYANSFVFNGTTGTMLEMVGAYIQRINGTGLGTSFRFEVFADNANSPDANTVLGTTGFVQTANQTLSLLASTLLAPISLTSGTRYWIAASTVGQTFAGDYQVGGHTQNSIYNDNGTFWYSNNPAGQPFDGQNQTPEMAIYAAGTFAAAVPEPSTFALGGMGLGWLVLARWRLARRRAA